MNASAAIDLLRKVSIFEMSGTDGCYCMHCKIRGVEIEVSCNKSSGTAVYRRIVPDFSGLVVRVHSMDLDACAVGRVLVGGFPTMQAVADVVCEQIREHTNEEIAVRLCALEHDEKQECVWCGEPRQRPEDYHCAACSDTSIPEPPTAKEYAAALSDLADYFKANAK